MNARDRLSNAVPDAVAVDAGGHATRKGIPIRPKPRSWLAAALAAAVCLSAGADAAGRWKIVPSPSTGTLNQLNAVAAVSNADAWAVGTTGLADFNSQGVTLHWDGRTWQSIFNPAPVGAINVNLLGVAAAAADDAWAVGRWGDGALGVHALALHWNGSAWQIADTPFSPNGATFQAVTVIAPDDVWAVGQDGVDTLTEHWDGVTWSVVPTPRLSHGGDLTAVAGTSSGDVWAVGSFFDRKLRTHSLVLHWDGTAWTISASPDNGASSELEGVAAISGNDVWAVGHAFPSNVATLTEHWDGASWTVVPGPEVSIGQFNAVVALSPRSVWAVGSVVGDGAQLQTLAEHWNGSAWTVSRTPAANQVAEFRGAAAIPHVVLAVGDANTTPQDPQQTLMEVHVP